MIGNLEFYNDKNCYLYQKKDKIQIYIEMNCNFTSPSDQEMNKYDSIIVNDYFYQPSKNKKFSNVNEIMNSFVYVYKKIDYSVIFLIF
jgi:hypothetical protein